MFVGVSKPTIAFDCRLYVRASRVVVFESYKLCHQSNDQIFSDGQDKAETFNNLFTAQTHLDDSGATLPRFASRVDTSLNTVSLSPKKVESTLKFLKVSKHLV